MIMMVTMTVTILMDVAVIMMSMIRNKLRKSLRILIRSIKQDTSIHPPVSRRYNHDSRRRILQKTPHTSHFTTFKPIRLIQNNKIRIMQAT